MALTKDDILNAIAEMPVMELVELIEAAEEKFNVSAADRVCFVDTRTHSPDPTYFGKVEGEAAQDADATRLCLFAIPVARR